MERLKVKKEHFSKDFDDPRLEEIRVKMSEATLVIENLQENLEYTRGRYHSLLQSDERKFDVEAELIYHRSYDSMESMRKIVVALLGRNVEALRETAKEREGAAQLKLEVSSLKRMV